jgi:hypothetical protein
LSISFIYFIYARIYNIADLLFVICVYNPELENFVHINLADTALDVFQYFLCEQDSIVCMPLGKKLLPYI